VVSPTSASTDPGGALQKAWLITAGLIVTTSLGLYFAHEQAIQIVLEWVGPAMAEGAEADEEGEYDFDFEDDFEEDYPEG